MTRVFAGPLALLLLSGAAYGQSAPAYGQAAPVYAPAPLGPTAARGGPASLSTAVQEAELQQLLMYQYLQGSGMPPSVRGAGSYPPGYFSNGASVTGVPAGSPYYSNGAAVSPLPPIGAATNDAARLSGPADTTTGVPYYSNGTAAVAGRLDTGAGPYFWNGASVTSVAPGSPYFTNGAEVTGVSAGAPDASTSIGPPPPPPPPPPGEPSSEGDAGAEALDASDGGGAVGLVTTTSGQEPPLAPVEITPPAEPSGEREPLNVVEPSGASLKEPNVPRAERASKVAGPNTPWRALAVGVGAILMILVTSLWSGRKTRGT